MNWFKKFLLFLKEPKTWFLIIFYILFVASVTSSILLLVLLNQQTLFHFISYFLSAFLLVYFVYTIIYFAPKIKNKTIENMQKHKFTRNLLNDYGYRTLVFATLSFVVNIAYVVFMGYFAFKTKSAWYISITFYYLALTFMKGNIFYSKKKYNTPLKQARAYRFCGIMLIFMDLAFSSLVSLFFTTNMSFEYAGLMIYFVAFYTFYKLTLSILNIYKATKQKEDFYTQAIRNINLTTSLVSLVVLQVSLLQAFATNQNVAIYNVITGGVISLIMIILSILMIIKANKNIKILKNNENILKNVENATKND